MLNNDLLEYVAECFGNLAEYQQVSYWNAYCEDENYLDDIIYSMDIVQEDLENRTAWELLTRSIVDMDSFNVNDEWAVSTIYGWKSADDPYDLVGWAAEDSFLAWLYENEGLGDDEA